MPRVHGVDIIPRRGRGPGRQRAPLVVDGVDTNANVLEATKAGAPPSHHHVDNNIHDDVARLSLNGALNETSGSRDEIHATASPTESPPGSNKSGKVDNGTMPSVEAATTTNANAHVVSSASTKDKGLIATSYIRPQPRESLNYIDFGSHSFSVQRISHKSPPISDVNNLRFDNLGPSLERTAESPPLIPTNNIRAQTAQSMEDIDDVANEPESTKDVEKINRGEPNPIHQPLGNETSHNIEGTTLTVIPQNAEDSTEEAHQNEDQPSVHTRDQSHTNFEDSISSSNAHWLIHRCSTACLQMEMSLSPLELALKTLHVIRSITDDNQYEELQYQLFAVLKNGKKRDLDFVFEVTERAVELRDDLTLNEESLRKASLVAACRDVTVDDNFESNYTNTDDDDELNAREDLATQPIEQSTRTSSPQIFHQGPQQQPEGLAAAHSTPSGQSQSNNIHRSKRKKRNSCDSPIANGADEMNASNASTSEKDPNREMSEGNNETIHADFATAADDLDMQDDEIWSFLPNTQPMEDRDNIEESPTRRVTRSMNLENNDDMDNTQPSHTSEAAGTSENCVGDDVAEDLVEDMEAQVIDVGTKVSDVRIACSDNEHVDSQPTETNEILLQTNDNVRVEVESPNDGGEVYSLVKMRERSEGKGSVRIIFTGLTPTRRHLQMIETIGAEYVHSIEEAHTATHVIASDGITKLRRTPKLMICICRVAQILSIEWLEQSSKQQCVLNTDDFLLLNDREAEKRYDFSMKMTLRNGIRARKRRGGVFGGWFVYICSGVAGNKAPSLKEIHLIIEAGGGQVLKSLSSPDAFDPTKTIVLTSDPSTKSQLGEFGVARAKRFGAKVLSTSWLFHTIITQNLFDTDADDVSDDESTIDPTTSHSDNIIMCASPASMASSIYVKSKSPVKRGRRIHLLPTDTPARATTTEYNDNESVCTRGSRVSHVEYAMPKKRKLNFKANKQATPQKCSTFITRQSHQTVLTSIKALSAGNDQAAYLTSLLWHEYFNDVGKASLSAGANKLSNRPRKGVRCLRGRNRSISPLVSCTNPVSVNKPTNATTCVLPKTICDQLLRDNQFVTWESYILFTLGDRSKSIMFNSSDEITPASYFFPHPNAIVKDDCTMDVDDSAQEIVHGLSLNLAASGSSTEGSSFKVFGTLKDLFTLHRQHQTTGMIPEQAIAMLSFHAIEAVAAMHSCGIAHNDIGLDSFLVVKKNETHSRNRGQPEHGKSIDSWYLQLIGFGEKAVVLNCQENCPESHFAHDYQCLANVIHLLITGGVEITLTSTNGALELASKFFIEGNLFLRGALSWCSLFQALMCVGNLAPMKETTAPFRLQYPVKFTSIASSDDERMSQFGWSCRVLQELCDRRILNDFIDGLCKRNSRFTLPSTDVSKYASSTCNGREAFRCYTSSEQTSDRLIEMESRLQSDYAALSKRETAFNEMVAKFEQSKVDQQSVLRRESDVQMRENDLLRRESKHAVEMKQLHALKEEIRLTEMRIEQKLQLLKATSPAPLRPIQQRAQLDDALFRHDEAQILQNSERKDRTRAKEPTTHERPIKSHQHAIHKSATKSVLEQPMRKVSGYLHKNRVHYTKKDTFLSPNSSQHNPKTALNCKPPSPDPLNGAIGEAHDDSHEEKPYSQDSTSSSKRKKKGSARKSPKCSLHFLPRSPQKTPKKVYIDLGEE